jgi:UDP-hydrolysing UDP-N-acetyl-D-glucosamine 2-epimerase
MNKYSGVGSEIDFHKPYLLVSQHPDTLEYQESRDQISATLQAIQELQIQAIWLWPNVDSGSDAISKKLREFREVEKSSRIRFYRNFEPVDYINVLRNSQCIVGNSSSGIREASFLGKPSVNVGLRQRGREKMKNVIDVPYDPGSISRAIRKQIDAGGFEPDYTYGRGDAGKRIAEILATNTLSIKKQVINFNDFQ